MITTKRTIKQTRSCDESAKLKCLLPSFFFFSFLFTSLFCFLWCQCLFWLEFCPINCTHFKTKSPDHKSIRLNPTIIITRNSTSYWFVGANLTQEMLLRRITTIHCHTLIPAQSPHPMKVQRQSKHAQTPNASQGKLHGGHLSHPTAAVTATSDRGFVAPTQVLFSILLSLGLGHSPPLKWGEMKTGFEMQSSLTRQVTLFKKRWREEEQHLKLCPLRRTSPLWGVENTLKMRNCMCKHI